MSKVSLREITRETVAAVCELEVAPEQTEFVASNARSIAEAYFQPKAWFRAVYAGEEPVGFVMLYDDPDEGRYFLWRFMIAAEHQGEGYGKGALDLLVEYVRTRPDATELRCSYVPGESGPGAFYAKYGFAETGEWCTARTSSRSPSSRRAGGCRSRLRARSARTARPR